MSIELKEITSSNIGKVGHSGDTLHVQFKNGALWSYTPVSAATFDEMMASGSIGSYFARHIKPACQAEKMSG